MQQKGTHKDKSIYRAKNGMKQRLLQKVKKNAQPEQLFSVKIILFSPTTAVMPQVFKVVKVVHKDVHIALLNRERHKWA